ncbi:hypothetical protein BGZ65_012202, partial [Modicella reniformis]
MTLYAKKTIATLASPVTPHSTFPAWSPSASTPLISSSSAASRTAASPATTSDVEPLPQRPTTSPPRKRDLPFVVFSPSKSQRRDSKSSMSSMDYDRLLMQDADDDLA